MPVTLNIQPTSRQLRQFAVLCFVAFPLLTWLWTRQAPATGWAAVVGGTVATAGWLQPAVVRPLFVLLTLITFPIGLVVGELAMLLVFALAFVPLAVLFRIIGRDSLQRRATADEKSFWQPRPSTRKLKDYFRQF
ncbi:MAG: hypothetical protein NXI04_19120 [Planctomycetaceae bacterium]|nr:hypothetical protein [Planctomycetaceae bacterium]